jgi:hypothetical protein
MTRARWRAIGKFQSHRHSHALFSNDATLHKKSQARVEDNYRDLQ